MDTVFARFGDSRGSSVKRSSRRFHSCKLPPSVTGGFAIEGFCVEPVDGTSDTVVGTAADYDVSTAGGTAVFSLLSLCSPVATSLSRLSSDGHLVLFRQVLQSRTSKRTRAAHGNG